MGNKKKKDWGDCGVVKDKACNGPNHKCSASEAECIKCNKKEAFYCAVGPAPAPAPSAGPAPEPSSGPAFVNGKCCYMNKKKKDWGDCGVVKDKACDPPESYCSASEAKCIACNEKEAFY